MESASKPGSQSMGVERGFAPSQGQGTASLVGFGATPQLFLVKPTQRKKSTRRRQRSVPRPNFARPQTRPQAALSSVYAVSRRWRDRTACLSDMAACFRKQGFRACGSDQRAMKTDEVCGRESVALRSPPTPLRSAHPCSLTFIATLVCASADAIMPCRNGFADV